MCFYLDILLNVDAKCRIVLNMKNYYLQYNLCVTYIVRFCKCFKQKYDLTTGRINHFISSWVWHKTYKRQIMWYIYIYIYIPRGIWWSHRKYRYLEDKIAIFLLKFYWNCLQPVYYCTQYAIIQVVMLNLKQTFDCWVLHTGYTPLIRWLHIDFSGGCNPVQM